MGSCATDELRLVIDAKELWPRVRGQFTDPRLRGLYEDLEHSGLERVLMDKHTLSQLTGAAREAGIVRSLTVGAVDEARRTTGSTDSHVRTRKREAPLDEHVHGAVEDPTMAVAELLEALNLTGEEQIIAGCYAIGARNPRDIAYVLDKPVDYVNERLRTLLPYLRGMLADKVAPDLDDPTRQLICRYAQGELHTTRHWRERHNAARLVANNPDCTHLYHAQCATDRRLRILLPTPILGALAAHHVAGATEPTAHAAGGLRQHIADATATARRHAADAYHRAIDPTPLAGMRPGAAGAVLASCLTIGGGAATYCVNQAVNPLDAIRGTATAAQHRKPKRAAAHKQSGASRALDSAAVAPPAIPPAAIAAPAKQPASPAPAASAPAAPSPPPSTPGDEFGPESASTSTTSSQQASTAARSRPAPAPANGPGEFGP